MTPAAHTQPSAPWCDSVDVFITPNVPALVTYLTHEGEVVTTTVVFRDILDFDGETFLVLANGHLMPLHNLLKVHIPERKNARQILHPGEAEEFQLVH